MLLKRTGAERRERIAAARILLVFTPELASQDPLAALEAALPHVDIVQVRPKPRGDRAPGASPGATIARARETYAWTRQVLDLVRGLPAAEAPLVFVNDRLDVARALADEGVDGVHVGTDDTPPGVAREFVGPDIALGRSTHGTADVAAAWDQPVDLIGFGPIFPSTTKGYGMEVSGTPSAGAPGPPVLGAEVAWVASEMSPVPLFPIGGIDLANADQLERVGRAAVGAAILAAEDPGHAAIALRKLLMLD